MSAPRSRAVMIAAAIWFIVAIAAGATGRVAMLRPPMPQVVVVGLTVLALLLGSLWPALRSWIAEVDLSTLISLHLIRLVAGITFVAFGRSGALPAAFADPAGWGDIGVALIAGLLVLSGGVKNERDRKVTLFWNMLGLADLTFVVASAARMAMTHPGSMAALLRLPLSLLPTFAVPILLATHVWIFRRLSAPVKAR